MVGTQYICVRDLHKMLPVIITAKLYSNYNRIIKEWFSISEKFSSTLNVNVDIIAIFEFAIILDYGNSVSAAGKLKLIS